MSSARAVIKQSVRATALSRPRSVGAAAAAAGAAASPAPPRAAAAAGAAEPSSTVARPQTMTSDMQDMAISIAMEALLKNNSETDVAADIKAAFESNTLTTRARGVARRRGRAARDAFARAQVALLRRAQLRVLRHVRGVEFHVLLHRPGRHLPLRHGLGGARGPPRTRRLDGSVPLGGTSMAGSPAFGRRPRAPRAPTETTAHAGLCKTSGSFKHRG